MLFSMFCFVANYSTYSASKKEESKNKETFLKQLYELKMMVDKLKEEVIYSNTKSYQHYTDIKDRMDVLGHLVDRLAGTKEPATKTNNWDSMRAAFRVPTKVEVNERN